MTGPEHYREAERLLAETERTPEDSVRSVATVAAQAQVHATLALAAATAMAGEHAHPYSAWPDGVAWYHAAGTKRAIVTAGED
jgi:hypothetical protein